MLPVKFQFLEQLTPLPKLINAGLQFLGVKEYTGASNNPVIMNMARELGIGNIYTNDATAWCGLFIGYLFKITGKPNTLHAYDILRARKYAEWGNPVERGEEMLGDILIFQREGGGHVGLYIAESDQTFFVLGGNQSNAVTITEIKKERLVAARRYYSIAPPITVKKYFADSTGNISVNEA